MWLGESPSSSASDVDNLNHPTTLDKVALPKGVSSPQVTGNHVIAARNRPNFSRLLNFVSIVIPWKFPILRLLKIHHRRTWKKCEKKIIVELVFHLSSFELENLVILNPANNKQSSLLANISPLAHKFSLLIEAGYVAGPLPSLPYPSSYNFILE